MQEAASISGIGGLRTTGKCNAFTVGSIVGISFVASVGTSVGGIVGEGSTVLVLSRASGDKEIGVDVTNGVSTDDIWVDDSGISPILSATFTPPTQTQQRTIRLRTPIATFLIRLILPPFP